MLVDLGDMVEYPVYNNLVSLDREVVGAGLFSAFELREFLFELIEIRDELLVLGLVGRVAGIAKLPACNFSSSPK